MISFYMLWNIQPIQEKPLPDGYSFSHFDPEKDIEAWGNCIHPGLNDEQDAVTAYRQEILGYPEIRPTEDIWFLDHNGEHIGTVTAFVWARTGVGHIHMVGIRRDHRGLGLAGYLSCIAQKSLVGRRVPYVTLHTDTDRPGALKSYLNAGFLPATDSEKERESFRQIMALYGMKELSVRKMDGTSFGTLHAE